MELSAKKDQIYRLVRTGLCREEAELLSECTVEEQDRLEKDEEYLARCALQPLIEEKRLLEQLDNIIEENSIKGVSTEIRWKLERINAARWGRSLNLANVDPPEERSIPDLSSLDPAKREVLLDAVATLLNGA